MSFSAMMSGQLTVDSEEVKQAVNDKTEGGASFEKRDPQFADPSA